MERDWGVSEHIRFIFGLSRQGTNGHFSIKTD
jgi:hypothetical protein